MGAVPQPAMATPTQQDVDTVRAALRELGVNDNDVDIAAMARAAAAERVANERRGRSGRRVVRSAPATGVEASVLAMFSSAPDPRKAVDGALPPPSPDVAAVLHPRHPPCVGAAVQRGNAQQACADMRCVNGLGVVPRGEQGVQKRKLHGATASRSCA